jgi:hypothetical protein
VSISSSDADSSTDLVSAFSNAPGPVNATPWAPACRTNYLAAGRLPSKRGGPALFPAGLRQRTGNDWWKRKKPAGSYRALTRTNRW